MLLLAADVSVLKDKYYFENAYRSVSKERQAKTDKLARENDKRLSLGAEVLLQIALKTTGENSDGLEFEYGTNQKPYLKNRAGIYFNLSHSGDFVLCALDGKKVGCDIEKIKSADMSIAKRFFHPDEYKSILSAKCKAEQNDLFYGYWTLKESFIKTVGNGISLPMNDFRIVIGKDKISVKQSFDENEYFLREFTEIPNYKCALCGLNDFHDVNLQIVDLF